MGVCSSSEQSTVDRELSKTLKRDHVESKAIIRILLLGAGECGKCWGAGTRLLMWDGSVKKVELIRSGEQLMGDDSTPRTVQPGTLTHRKGLLYNINFTNSVDGCDDFTCNGEHVLVLRCNEKPRPIKMDGVWKIAKWTLKNVSGSDEHKYPVIQQVKYETRNTADDDAAHKLAHCFTFATRQDCQLRINTMLAEGEWQPLEFTTTVNHYLRLPLNTRRTLTMFRPGPITFPAPSRSLSDLVHHALLQHATSPRAIVVAKTLCTSIAWALGVWLVAGKSDHELDINDVGKRNYKFGHARTALVNRLIECRTMIARALGWIDRHASTDHEFLRLKNKSDLLHAAVNEHANANHSTCYDVDLGPVFHDVLVSYNMLHKKHIPLDLLREHPHLRQWLLAGLIEGSGYDTADDDEYVFQLPAQHRHTMKSVCHLARGLGHRVGRVCVHEIVNEETGKVEDGWRIVISGPRIHSIKTLLDNKHMDEHRTALAEANQASVSDCADFTIEKAQVGDFYGFTLDGNHRCLTADFIVTHNSTILKQMKILHRNGFTEDEIAEYRITILDNTLSSMRTLIAAADHFGMTMTTNEARVAADQYRSLSFPITSSSSSGTCLSTLPFQLSDLRQATALLWQDQSIHTVLDRSNEYTLLDSAEYFITHADRILDVNYHPINQDILRSRKATTGVVETDFVMDKIHFKLFDVGGQRGERKKWIHCFEDVKAILFIASLNEYDQVLAEDPSRNRLEESLTLFEGILTLPWFKNTSVILFLNKNDLFAKKCLKTDLGIYFSDYVGGLNHEFALFFIKEMFFARNFNPNKTVYAHVTDATDTKQIEFVWRAVKHIVMQNNLAKAGLMS